MYHTLRRALFRLVPKYNETLYTISKRYVDHYNGQNNSDPRSNGEFRFVQAHAKNWHAVFDVGAHIGEWTQAVLAANPNAQVHCFEPVPETFKRLGDQRFQDNVYLNAFALSSSPGQVSMYIDGGSGCNSLFDRQWTFDGSQKAHQAITVETTTVDAYCREHDIPVIDMMKMDVEGAEMSVLKGAQNMLAEGRIRCMQFEYDRSYIDAQVRLKDMFELLQPLGFQLGKIYPESLRIHTHYDQRLENYINQNWFARLQPMDSNDESKQ